jgi:hypothetical protein
VDLDGFGEFDVLRPRSANPEFGATIQLPGGLASATHSGLRFAVADDGHLTHRNAQVIEVLANRTSATLPEGDIVFIRSTLVGVALDHDGRIQILEPVRGATQ